MIQFNIMGLKHALERRECRLYLNQEIAIGSNISETTIGNLLRGNTKAFDIATFSKLVHYFQREGLAISMGDFFRWDGSGLVSNVGFLIIRLNPVPRYSLIAQETGIPLSRLKNLARGNVKRIYLSDLAALLEFFRKKGIEIKLGDLLREVKAVSRIDENDYSEEKTVEVLDRKRHDFVPKQVKVNAEYDDSIRKWTAFVEAQQSKLNTYVPIIHTNIMMLKHLLTAKKRKQYFNRKISQEAQVDYDVLGNLIRGNVAFFYLSTMGKLAYYFQREGLIIEVGDFFCWQGDELVLNIGSLMARLDPIPMIKKVHDETGIPVLRVKNLVRGNIKRIYLDDLAALLVFFRKRGLDIKLGDLLREEGIVLPRTVFFEGMKEGARLAEERKALEISRNMVDVGMDVAQIATVTGLKLEQIKALA